MHYSQFIMALEKISWLFTTDNGHCTKRNSLFAIYNGHCAKCNSLFAIYNGLCTICNGHCTKCNSPFAIYNDAGELIKVILQPAMAIVKRAIYFWQFTMGYVHFTMFIVQNANHHLQFTMDYLQFTMVMAHFTILYLQLIISIAKNTTCSLPREFGFKNTIGGIFCCRKRPGIVFLAWKGLAQLELYFPGEKGWQK